MLGSLMTHHIWSPNWERVPGSNVFNLWVKLQRLQFQFISNSRKQTDIIINLWANCISGFMLMLFDLLCKTWSVVKPGAWLTRSPPGAQKSQDFPPILSMLLQVLHSQQSLPVRSVSRQVISKVRDLLCFISEA